MRYFVRDPVTKSTKIIYKAPEEIQTVAIVQPTTINLAGKPQAKRFRCIIEGCGKTFATQGVASIHYKRNHAVTDDRDEWRQHIETLNVPNGPGSR